MPDPRLILFDIDCTLLRTGGAGMVALGRALSQVLGETWQEPDPPVRPDGQTDPNLVRLMLGSHGVPSGRWAELEQQTLAVYPGLLAEELEQRRAQARLEPGIMPLLNRLARCEDTYLGVLTGNIESTARLKLDRFDLNRFFPIGAFGSDCADRDRLGSVALERARRHFGKGFVPSDCWVVGDTDRDVRCARAAGMRVLAVATGSWSLAQLEEWCPDLAVQDLSEPAAMACLCRF